VRVLAAATTISTGSLSLIYVLALAVLIVGFSQILRKAGYSPWWALLALIPVVNLVMLLVFAFANWPVLRRTSYDGYYRPPPFASGPPMTGGQWGAPGPHEPPNWSPPKPPDAD
jgi:hypothetical protein